MPTLLRFYIDENSFKGLYSLALFADEFIGYSDELLLAVLIYIIYLRIIFFQFFSFHTPLLDGFLPN
jgi:hypothetical protein